MDANITVGVCLHFAISLLPANNVFIQLQQTSTAKGCEEKGTREQARPVSPSIRSRGRAWKRLCRCFTFTDGCVSAAQSYSYVVALVCQWNEKNYRRKLFVSCFLGTRKVTRLRAVGHTSAEWRQRAAIYGAFKSFSGNLVSHCFSWQPKQKSYFQSLNFFRICSRLVEVICLS